MSLEEVVVNVLPLSGIVFYPNISLPLNVFEPRYITMVKESEAEKVPIALVQAKSREVEKKEDNFQVEDFYEISGVGRPRFLRERPDGSLLLILEGFAKICLKAVELHNGYPRCHGRLIEERKELSEVNQSHYHQMRQRLLIWIERNIAFPDQKELLINSLKNPPETIDCYASFLVKDVDLRQLLLEENDVNKRMELMIRMPFTED
jgi:ATP-dependent Lon protease